MTDENGWLHTCIQHADPVDPVLWPNLFFQATEHDRMERHIKTPDTTDICSIPSRQARFSVLRHRVACHRIKSRVRQAWCSQLVSQLSDDPGATFLNDTLLYNFTSQRLHPDLNPSEQLTRGECGCGRGRGRYPQEW